MACATALAVASLGYAQASKNQKDTKGSSIPSANCPIAMTAKYGTGGGLEVVQGAPQHRGIGQELHIRITNAKLAVVSAVRITVQGWNGQGRTVPAQEMDLGQAGASRKMILAMTIAPRQTVDKYVWVNGLTSVDSIYLDAVLYQDGSSWEPKASAACRVVPDPLMLISKKK
jgi:hypothetical protein